MTVHSCMYYVLHLYIYLCMSLPISDAATFSGDRSSFHLSLAFWLSPFLPSLMFEHSPQLWCLFFSVHSFSGGTECFTVRRFERERERERERETGCIAHWIVLAFKLNYIGRAGTSTRAGRAYPFFCLSGTFQEKGVRCFSFLLHFFSRRCLQSRNRTMEHVRSCE